jgi:hypothetical protein
VAQSGGVATYHGLETSVQRRFHRGLSVEAAYTWSRTIDNQTVLDPFNLPLNKGLSNFHLAHRFLTAGVWEVPYGRGRRFGSSAAPVVNAILGGWQASGFLVFRTGTPLTIGIQGDNLNTGGGYTQVPNRLRDATLPRGDRSRTRFFDTGAFERPAQYAIGNAGKNILIGPGNRNLDFSISKVFPLAEKRHLQFRAELFNAANHPNWGNPGTTLGTAAFGTITSNENLPRIIQLGLKLVY